ncbi:hypothetical protein KY360_03655 [Candidatus Woesearchaeota archaeon]|nr:hypothetical protein [Candidatus Woesearchaeota archaeon]
MEQKRRPITTTVKYAILAYVIYIAAHGCYSVYQSATEKTKAGVEWVSKTKDDISNCVDQARNYFKGNEQQKNTPLPSHGPLEEIAGE